VSAQPLASTDALARHAPYRKSARVAPRGAPLRARALHVNDSELGDNVKVGELIGFFRMMDGDRSERVAAIGSTSMPASQEPLRLLESRAWTYLLVPSTRC
jgi:hypothetical protein